MKKNALIVAALIAVVPGPLLAQDEAAEAADAAAEAAAEAAADTVAAAEAAATVAPDMEARMALAREIGEIAYAERQLDLAFERMLPGVVAKMLDDVMRMSPSRDIAEQIENNYPGGFLAFQDAFSDRYATEFRSHYPELLEAIASYWAENMTLEQLEGTAEFFRTDLGSVWVGLLPGVYQHMTTLGREYSLQEGITIAGQMMGELDSGREDAEDGEADASDEQTE